jgi:pimeloyl-ACP methyl ester carboxylesterase
MFKYVRFVPLATLMLLIVLLHSCMSFRSSSKEIDQYFKEHDIAGFQHQYKVGFREMHYIEAGDDSQPLILFVHGSPGSSNAFIDFLGDTSLTNHAQLISTDRPGFGYSNYGNAIPSLHQQSEFIKPILDQYKGQRRVILVGHSLGGPLICRMAMDYPDLIDGLIICTPRLPFPELGFTKSFPCFE